MLLVLDLKRFEVAPLVILNAYRRLPASIMNVGTWIITMFTLVSLVTVVLLYLDGWSLVRKIVEIFGVILGLARALDVADVRALLHPVRDNDPSVEQDEEG